MARTLHLARTDGWEFIGCAEEESRPTPVMLVTASEIDTPTPKERGILGSQRRLALTGLLQSA